MYCALVGYIWYEAPAEEMNFIIMLYYFEGMTDVEIGKLFNTSRSTIQYRRTSSFEILKKYLEEHADEWDEW